MLGCFLAGGKYLLYPAIRHPCSEKVCHAAYKYCPACFPLVFSEAVSVERRGKSKRIRLLFSPAIKTGHSVHVVYLTPFLQTLSLSHERNNIRNYDYSPLPGSMCCRTTLFLFCPYTLLCVNALDLLKTFRQRFFQRFTPLQCIWLAVLPVKVYAVRASCD